MDVMQAIKGRRSIRRFKPDLPSDEAIKTVLEAARWAPSWANTQCWRLVLVKDQTVRGELAATCHPVHSNRPRMAAEAILSAPICIVVCGLQGRSGYIRNPDGSRTLATEKGDWFMFDVALAMENLVLAAYSVGLGTLHIGLFDAIKAAEVVGVPMEARVVELMPLGYPDEEPIPPRRKEFAEWVFYERYGQAR